MEYLNNIIEYYDELYPVTNEQKDLYNELTKELMPARFLRIGCGTGALEHWLSKNGHDVTGLETNLDMIEAANLRRRLPNMALRFFQMSSLEMTRFLGKGFYNIISCLNDSIIFINDKILLRKFFYDCKVLLAEKGVLVLQFTNFKKYLPKQAFALPVRESIRTKLSSFVSEKAPGEYVLSQELEHCGNKSLKVVENVPISLINVSDIETAAKEAGFTSFEFYGDYKKTPLTENSDNIVCLLR